MASGALDIGNGNPQTAFKTRTVSFSFSFILSLSLSDTFIVIHYTSKMGIFNKRHVGSHGMFDFCSFS